MLNVKLKIQQWFYKRRKYKLARKVFTQPSDSSSVLSILWLFTKTGLILALASLVLFPLYFMISTSLMSINETISSNPSLVPSEPIWSNYTTVFKDGYWQSMLVTTLVTALSITSQLIVTSLMGYAFALKNWRFKKIMWYMYLSLLMLPQLALMLGQYQLVVDLRLQEGTGPIIAMFIPYAASVMSAYMFKNAFEAIPDRTKEAAIIDGVSSIKYFIKVAIPLVKPAFWTVAILTAFASWNAYTWPTLIFGGQASIYRPLSLWLFTVGKAEVIPGDPDSLQIVSNLQMAASVLTTLPLFLAYFLLKKRIMTAISKQGNAIKG